MPWAVTFEQYPDKVGFGIAHAMFNDDKGVTVHSFHSIVDTNIKNFRDNFIAQAKQELSDFETKQAQEKQIANTLEQALNGIAQ